MTTRKAAFATSLGLVLAMTSFGCASSPKSLAPVGPPPGQAVDDFDEYECPNCIGPGESTIDENVTQ